MRRRRQGRRLRAAARGRLLALAGLLLLLPIGSGAAEGGRAPLPVSAAPEVAPGGLERERTLRDRAADAFEAADAVVAPAFDLIVLRPLGAAATVVGVPFFVAATPFVAPRYGMRPAFDLFVYAPLDYTFLRPLGEF